MKIRSSSKKCQKTKILAPSIKSSIGTTIVGKNFYLHLILTLLHHSYVQLFARCLGRLKDNNSSIWNFQFMLRIVNFPIFYPTCNTFQRLFWGLKWLFTRVEEFGVKSPLLSSTGRSLNFKKKKKKKEEAWGLWSPLSTIKK